MRAFDPIAVLGGDSEMQTFFDNLARAIDNFATDVGALPNLVQGSGSNVKLKSTNTVKYRSAGICKSVATFEVAFTAGTAGFTGAQDVTPNANSIQERAYVVCVNAAGTPSIIAGVQTTVTVAGTAPIPDLTSTVPTEAGGPEGVIVGAGYPADQTNAAYPASVTSSPLGLRANNLTPIGIVWIAAAAGASGFEGGTTQPATAGAITATYLDGYPTPQILTAQ